MKPALSRPSAPSLPAKQSAYPGVAIACTPRGVDAYAEATFLFLHIDGDVGQLPSFCSRLLSSNRKGSRTGRTSSWAGKQTRTSTKETEKPKNYNRLYADQTKNNFLSSSPIIFCSAMFLLSFNCFFVS